MSQGVLYSRLREGLNGGPSKNVRERFTTKHYCPVILLSVVSNVFEKLINNMLVDHLEKCGQFSDFSINCKSSDSCI